MIVFLYDRLTYRYEGSGQNFIYFAPRKMADVQVHQWLRLTAEGDEVAFRSLYDRYHGKVFSVALDFLRDPVAAQDIMQDIFVKVWENRQHLGTVLNFGGWVATLTRNYVINSLKRKIPANFQDDISDREFTDERANPEEHLDLQQMEKLIREAVSSLPPRQAEVYELSRDSALSNKEIAARLGLSYHTVREHLALALKGIRSYLVVHYGELGLLLWIVLQS
jgi:RNA polymerase sigma-70 factor (family 1)